MVLSVWSVLGRHGVVCLFWVVTVLFVWSDVRCHGGLCCPFGPLWWFWVVMVLFVWSVSDCYYGIVCLVRFFGLLWCYPFGPLLDCHGVTYLNRLVGFRFSRYTIYFLNII